SGWGRLGHACFGWCFTCHNFFHAFRVSLPARSIPLEQDMAQKSSFNLAWAALGLMAVMLAGCVANEPKSDEVMADVSEPAHAQWDEAEARRLEKFAVSQCLIRAFPDSPMASDAHRA